MTQVSHPLAHEASTDERASSLHSSGQATVAALSPPGDADRSSEFEPVPLRYRSDGWTPQKQCEFVEHLAETGVIRQAAAMVGMTEQSVSRLRRRPEARAFNLVCDAAQRAGARRLVSVAYERAVEGTVRGHYYHGELKGEERVYDNKLLMFLIGKLAPALAPLPGSKAVEMDWDGWMQAIEEGVDTPARTAAAIEKAAALAAEAPVDEFYGTEVWDEPDGWWTRFPPPPDFDGVEDKDEYGHYKRRLTREEMAVIEAEIAGDMQLEAERRDRYFGFAQAPDSSLMEAEPYEPSGTTEGVPPLPG